MKLGNVEFKQTKIAGAIVNRPVRRKSIANRIIPKNFSLVDTSIFFSSKPADYTVGMDSTYRRPSACDLTLTEWAYLVLGAFVIVFGFVWYLWFLHDLDQTFRAFLAIGAKGGL